MKAIVQIVNYVSIRTLVLGYRPSAF